MGLLFLIYLYRKTLKIFLSETTGPISIEIGRNVSLVTLYQDYSSHLDSSKNMAASCVKPLDRFQYNLADIFLWWPSTKIVKAIMISQKKHGHQGAGLIFSLYLYTKL